ncbi:subtilisin like protease [Sorangium cellulosum]|uniref:Subtilisin like protease n=1 Tax=Sorangium cellulosum TaxID=56 RepID=A0A2L0F434_SORCE|nr:S8 family serine peptidase [Sorangium cellulosum]AUX46306.1 subtilisin like protease [Sorangium cellulosum]
MRRTGLGVVGAALLWGGGASDAIARPSAGAAETGAWIVDGGRRVAVERLGNSARDASGRTLAPVRLRYPGGQVVEASVGATAIVEIEAGMEGALAAAGVELVRPLMPSIGSWLVRDAGGGDGLDLAQRLSAARTAGVREVMPDFYVRLKAFGQPFTPDDPRLPGQWYFDDLRMEEAWGRTLGDAATTIVVIDNGCDLDHPDLAAKMDPGRDVIDGDDDPTYLPGETSVNHGTACAGLVAAETNNGEGIAGGCPACRVRCVRLLDDEPQPLSASVEAFDFALEVNASVVSNSWGYAEPMPVPRVVENAINRLFDAGRDGKGALVLFASGNDDRKIADDEIQAVRGVLNVGAVNHLEEETAFTNYGSSLDLVAPAGTLTTDIAGSEGDDPTDYTSLFGGTSSACPVAAGIAGLLVSAAPERTAVELYDILTRTARPAPYALPDENGHDPVFGYGIIDPVAALREVLGDEPPPPPPPPVDEGGSGDEKDEQAGCTCAAAGSGSGERPSALHAIAGAVGLAALMRWRRRRHATGGRVARSLLR